MSVIVFTSLVKAETPNYFESINKTSEQITSDIVKFTEGLFKPEDFYLNFETGNSYTEFYTFGYNSGAGSSTRYGEYTDTNHPVNRFGIGKSFDGWRVEISYTHRPKVNFRTNGHPGPPKKPRFFYDVELQSTSFTYSIYRDFENTSPFTPFLGVGFSRMSIDMDAADGVVETTHRSTDKEAHGDSIEAVIGISMELTETSKLTAGYRYIHTERFMRPLTSESGIYSGEYGGSLRMDEYFVGLRVNLK